VTSESASSTEPWVKEHGMEYAYAYDKSKTLARSVGATSLPSAILVDATGNIVYLGHPGSVTAAMIEAALDGALSKPLFEWPKELNGVAKDVRKGDFGDALAELEKLGDAHADIAAELRGLVKGRVAQVEKARDAGDWLRVETLGEPLAKGLGKLEEAATVQAILDTLDKDKAAKEILKAQQKVAKIFAGDVKKNQFDKVERDLGKIVEEFAGTAAERDARAGLEKLKALRAG
jgi:hypothetical protein